MCSHCFLAGNKSELDLHSCVGVLKRVSEQTEESLVRATEKIKSQESKAKKITQIFHNIAMPSRLRNEYVRIIGQEAYELQISSPEIAIRDRQNPFRMNYQVPPLDQSGLNPFARRVSVN